MDPMTIVGIILMLATTFGAMFMGGIDPVSVFFGSPSSIIIVLGGTIGATVAGAAKEDATGAAKVLMKALTGVKPFESGSVIEQMVSFSETARRDGLLALEDAAKDIDDDFLRKGIQMAVDGADPETVQEVLDTDIEAMVQRHKKGAGFFSAAAGYAPAFGVAGTVIGLIDMLNNLNDPSALGPSIAVAFITTLWGVFLANYVFGPIANKLKAASANEVAFREMVVEGVVSIQAGTNPRALADKLASFLPPSERDQVGESKSA